MFKKTSEFLNILKTNKKLFYTFSLFVILVILLIVLKIDLGKDIDKGSIKTDIKTDNNIECDNYTDMLEKKLEDIIKKIDGIDSVSAMVYTKNSCKLEPLYDESTNVETSSDSGSSNNNKVSNRSSIQKQIKVDRNNEALKKYYEYPDITGVLIVVSYTGNDNIYGILMNSVKILLDIEINDIEIIVSSKRGGN